MKKRGLGRNLNVLLSRSSAVVPAVNPETLSQSSNVVKNATFIPLSGKAITNNELRYLPVDVLQRGRYQPRRDFSPEALQELADSIKSQGIIQPIIVRSVTSNSYEIIAGERRWRAAQLAKLTEVPVVIKDIDDETALAIALIENIQRENLNPLEEAIALQRLLDEFTMTHEEIAQAVGKSRTTISNLLRLLNLQPEVKTLVENRQLEMGHARALLGLNNLAQIEAAKIVAAKGLSVRATERLVKEWQISTQEKKSATHELDPNIRYLQQTLSDKLGAHVHFQHHCKGKGKLIIHYNNLDELDGILAKIK